MHMNMLKYYPFYHVIVLENPKAYGLLNKKKERKQNFILSTNIYSLGCLPRAFNFSRYPDGTRKD